MAVIDPKTKRELVLQRIGTTPRRGYDQRQKISGN